MPPPRLREATGAQVRSRRRKPADALPGSTRSAAQIGSRRRKPAGRPSRAPRCSVGYSADRSHRRESADSPVPYPRHAAPTMRRRASSWNIEAGTWFGGFRLAVGNLCTTALPWLPARPKPPPSTYITGFEPKFRFERLDPSNPTTTKHAQQKATKGTKARTQTFVPLV
jgi:hypothetical protein